MFEITAARRRVAVEFLRFGTVGAAGFVVDTAVVYALRFAVGLYWAGLYSYVAAASFTWLGNRVWSFRGRGAGPMHRQWLRFLAANGVGFILNRGTYALLILYFPLFAAYPVLAIAGGIAAGMFVNFHLSRTLVFR